MSKANIYSLVEDIGRGLHDPNLLDYTYEEVLKDIARSETLTEATIIQPASGTALYTAPADTIELLDVIWDSQHLTHAMRQDVEWGNPSWRIEVGKPIAWVTENEQENDFRLYPAPELSSQDWSFMFGSPLGLDFPAYSALVIHTTTAQTVPDYLDLPIALQILAREFSRESDHRDLVFAETCHELSKALFSVLMRMPNAT